MNIQIISDIIAKHIPSARIWKEKRVYLNDLYNTKKCKQTGYISLDTFEVICYTDCPSQPAEWCDSQSQQVINYYTKYARLMRIAVKGQKLAAEPVEVVMHNALLDAEEVKGYVTEWREVRVAINRFGKLATRKRQYVVAFKGSKSNAPRGFVQLSDAAYDILSNIRKGEDMLEPYAPVPDYEEIAQRVAANVAKN